MVLGLVASKAVLVPIIRFINWSFVLTMSILQTDSITGLLSIAGYLCVYAFMISSIMMMVFGMPQTLPDRIVRWISAGTLDMGEQSTTGRIESSASHGARSAMMGGAQNVARQKQKENEA